MSSLPDCEVYGTHSVYRCYDAEGQLLYVGCARDVPGRMYHHLQLCNIGKQPNGTLRRHMATWTTEEYGTKLDARAAERKAILEGAPLLNRQHNPRRFRKVGGGRYALVEPVHPLTRWAFPELPVLREDVSA